MAAMEQQFPGSRECRSLPASSRFPAPSGAGQPGAGARARRVSRRVHLDVLAMMMAWEKADVAALAAELVATGLATPESLRSSHAQSCTLPLPAGAAG